MPVEARAWLTGEYPNQQINFDLPSGPKGDPGGWEYASTLTPSRDLNTVTIPGMYLVPGTSTYPNNPLGGVVPAYLEVILYSASSGAIMQRVTSYNDPRSMYVRRGVHGGPWGAWMVYNSTRVDNTAGRVIYQWDNTANREQLIYGDTGWRNVPTMALVTTTQTPSLMIRRQGNYVTLGVESFILVNSVPSYVSFLKLPTGFGPFPTIKLGPQYEAPTKIYSEGMDLKIAGTLPAGQCRFQVTYPTSDPWPTALPGTAQGAIQNN